MRNKKSEAKTRDSIDAGYFYPELEKDTLFPDTYFTFPVNSDSVK